MMSVCGFDIRQARNAKGLAVIGMVMFDVGHVPVNKLLGVRSATHFKNRGKLQCCMEIR